MTTTNAALDALDREISREIARLAININARQKRLAPIDTGNLRASIGPSVGSFPSVASAQRDQASISAGNTRSANGLNRLLRYNYRTDGTVYISSTANYAEFVNANHPTRKMFVERAVAQVTAEENRRPNQVLRFGRLT